MLTSLSKREMAQDKVAISSQVERPLYEWLVQNARDNYRPMSREIERILQAERARGEAGK